jgi:type IV pilus assembly protein PilW
MIAVTLGLVVLLAVTSVLVNSDSSKRAGLAVNDINQAGALAAMQIDSALRSAASGFANRAAEVYGCRLNVRRSGANWLPRTSAWPAPFAGFTQNVRVLPVLIGKGQSGAGSDVLAVMRGNAGVGEAALEVLAAGNPLGLRNTIGLRDGDLLLLADGGPECLLLQATGLPAPVAGQPVLNAGVAEVQLLGGTGAYHTLDGPQRTLASFDPVTPDTVAVHLGSGLVTGTTPRNAPQFTLYGVGEHSTLFSLDLLGIDGGAPLPIMDGVVELRALYGLDTDGDNVLDTWADPGTAPYTAAALMAGTPAAQLLIDQIVAVRVGLILRTSRQERDVVSPGSIVLFRDLPAGLRQTRTLSADEQRFRYRTYEFTVPLRNVLMARGQ